ncbi:hypothetical protein [Kitasatospora indigofera]|uniref:hypothetical protein n=1 Tax=Kitasatospora indigofera TaxID=67307 RepID=UPI0033BBF406
MAKRTRLGTGVLFGVLVLVAALGVGAVAIGERGAQVRPGARSLTAARDTGGPKHVTAPPAGPAARDARLLAAEELPLLVSGTDVWRETATYFGRGQSSDLPCLRSPVDGLGAGAQALRTFRQATRPGGAFNFYYAAELIADFASPAAAGAAAALISEWIGRCAQDGVLPGATVTARGPGQWSVTAAVPGPDRNSRLGAQARTEGEFAVQRRGSTVAVLYVGAETDTAVPWDRMQTAAAKALARL